MWTQEQTERKIANQIKAGELVMGDGKVIIPIPQSLIDQVTLTRLYVLHNARKKKITPAQCNGYKGSIDEDNALNIFQKLPIKKEGYSSLEVVNTYLSREEKAPLEFSQCFRSYMSSGGLYGSHYFINKLQEFFRYMPQLKTIYEPYFDHERYNNLEGYCCEDCDGPESDWISRTYENSINEIARELDRIKIINYGQK
jgi:hypothetical protein